MASLVRVRVAVPIPVVVLTPAMAVVLVLAVVRVRNLQAVVVIPFSALSSFSNGVLAVRLRGWAAR